MIPKSPNNVLPDRISTEYDASNREVIVKLRFQEETKRAFHRHPELPAGDTFARLLMDNKVEAISPLFDESEKISFAFPERAEVKTTVSLDDLENESLQGLNVLRFTSPQAAAEGVLMLSEDPMVEYAHVPAIKKFMSPDPHQNRQWGLRAIDYFGAQNLNLTASGIKIAILDSGIDPNHPDLKGIYSDNVNFTTLGPDDDEGHGTHVAGIIAALTNNGKGITGVCGSTKLMVLRGLTKPFQFKAYYNALRYAIQNGAQVLNCSLGGGYDLTEAALIRTAISKGMIVVAAMGNDYESGNAISYPAAYPDVISVGATTESDKRAAFSQTGQHIDLVAPGKNILSTVPGYSVSLTTVLDFDAWDGTSMATPFVTAAVALMLDKKPSATLSDVRKALTSTAVKIDGQTGFTPELGHGLLNLKAALTAV